MLELAEERAYKVYIADTLYAMGESKRLTQRYSELIKPRKADNRTARQIADDIIKGAGIKVVKGSDTA